MLQDDKSELLRLTNMLRDIDVKLERGSVLREGLIKAVLILEIGFLEGHRHDMEHLFSGLVLGRSLAEIEL